MSRDNSSNRWFASEGELTAVPFVLAAEATVLSTKDISPDATWGAEIRFGSTLGGGSNLGGQQPYAWELAYWGLAGDEQEATHSIATPYDTFLWGGIDYSGLEYNRDGTGPQIVGYIPVNYFFGHSSFWGAYNGSIRLLGVRVRNDFQAQNLELNFLKLPIYGGHATPSPISVTTVGGVRYLKFDEEFQNAVMFTTFDQVSGLPPNVAYPDDPTEFTGFGDDLWHLYHDIEVDNQLVGFQLGANLNWAVSRRWDLFCDGMFGVYNNRIEVFQHVYSGSGEIVRFASDQSPAIVKGKKDELALMGELRTGIGFQVTSHCRLTAAYRMMVVNGVALAVEQIPLGWPTAHDVATIHSNSSLVLHGLQLGAEFNF